MAIAYDNDTLNVNSGTSTSESFAHTCTGSDLTLVAFFMMFSTASNSISGTPTYNSVNMTAATSLVEYNYQLNRYFNLIGYYLNAPATGSNTLAVSYSGATAANAVWVASYTGANNGIGSNTGSGTGNDNNPGLTFTTDNATGLSVAAFVMLGADSDPFTPDGSETERQDTDTGGGSTTTDFGIHCLELAATGGSDTLSSTATVSDHWLTLGFEINAAGGGGGVTVKNLALLGVG